MGSGEWICDGCGQPATPEHLTRRLRRLENMTRYRPLHVQTLFLGAVSPAADGDHLYSADGEFRGEGAALLRAVGIVAEGRTVQETLAEFQRRGYLFTYILECPTEGHGASDLMEVLEKRIDSTMARLRRSLKPKRLVLLGEELDSYVSRFRAAGLAAELVSAEDGGAFRLNDLRSGRLVTKVTASGNLGL